MAELGRRASGAGPGDVQERAGTRDGPDVALRARHDIEQVAVEAVRVGDYILLDTVAHPASARCVIKKCAKTNERTGRVVGWLLELNDSHLAWWTRGELLWRRRTPAPA